MLRLFKSLLENTVPAPASASARRNRHGSGMLAPELLEQRIVLTSMNGLGLTATSAIVTDSAGNSVGELNLDYQGAMASTTKIMTALIAIEAAQNSDETGITLDDVVTIGFYPTQVQGSTSDPAVGEQFLLRDLLQISIGNSDNEITQAIAEHIVGQTSTSVATGVSINNLFVNMMNDRAAELGLNDTSFRNPHGRDPGSNPELGPGPAPNNGHFSTAADLARLGRIAMQNEFYAELAANTSTTVTSTRSDGTTRTYAVGTTNGLLTTMPYPGVEGVKGGATGQAGWMLVSQATILGKTLNGVVMDADSWNARNLDTHKILNFGFQEKYGWIVDESAFTVDTRTGFYDVTTGAYTVEGTGNNDNIQVWRYADDMYVSVNGISEWLPIEDLTQLHITAGAGNDWIQVSGSPEGLPVSIDAGSDDDTILIGAGMGLSIVDSIIAVDGGTGSDELRLNDMYTIGGQQYELLAGSVLHAGIAIVNYDDIETLRIDATSYADEFHVNGIVGEVEFVLNGRGGVDTLVGDNLSNDWELTSLNTGELNGDLFLNVENLTGGPAADVFRFVDLAELTGSLDGGAGRDRLDYTAFDHGVTVDLAAGTASNIDGSVSGIEDVTGTRYNDKLLGDAKSNTLRGLGGNDLLVGRSGDDRLVNASGRSVMIAGLGSDRIDGSRSDELMIASATTYDNTLAALDAILAVWNDGTKSPAERAERLRSGVWVGKQFVRLSPQTILQERAIDSLFGNGGEDWLWTS